MNIISLLVTALFISYGTALADDQFLDVSKMSEKELEKLPIEVRDNLPIRKLFKKLEGGQTNLDMADYLSMSALSRLLYFDSPTEEQKTAAIKKFQRDVGQQQTGELTFGQFNELLNRSKQTGSTPIYAPVFGEKIEIYKSDDLFTAKGTWIIEGEKIAYPINYSYIYCHKEKGVCEIDQAEILRPDHEISILNLDKTVYKILSWNTSEVISQSGNQCRITILTINASNNEVFQITRNKNNKGCDTEIAKIPPLSKPRISRLVPGWKLSREYWENRDGAIRKLTNTDTQLQFKSLTEEIIALEKRQKEMNE